jgi:hypothetical protein
VTPAERFARKCAPPDENGCIRWTGSHNWGGYGQFVHRRLDGRPGTLAHRFAWEHFHKRTIPDGLDLDHLCRVRDCVNPDHLDPATRSTNSLRGAGPTLVKERAARITHCTKGHEYTPENTYRNNGKRGCKTCNFEYARIYRERRRAS